MSGSNVPYHLRPNKFVERELFLEALERIGHFLPLEDYVYVSMGGRFLEDFKLLHRRFGVKDLISIESDGVTYDRQVFNRPLKIIRCMNRDSAAFITRFGELSAEYPKRPFIIWLDYAAAKERQKQLRECQDLVAKLGKYDILKITLNANIATLGAFDSDDSDTRQQKRYDKCKQQLGDCFPDSPTSHKDITQEGFARLLAKAVQKAVLKGLQAKPDLAALPVALFRYNDAFHQMVTVMVAIIEATKQNTFLKRTQLDQWQFAATSWDDVKLIAVPDLSWKERLLIDENIFAESAEQVHAGLTFKLDNDNVASLEALEQYVEHYRRYPGFVRAYL